MRLPSVLGVSFLKRMELVGLLPLKILNGASFFISSSLLPEALSSVTTSSSCLALHQGLCLRKEVRKQYAVVVPDRVVAYRRREKITGDELCALVDELIEGMLAVCPWLSPDNRACLPADFTAVSVNVFAVALHVTLLEIGRKAMHILVIGEDGMRLGICKNCCTRCRAVRV